MKRFRMRDSRDRESQTLTFVAVTWAALVCKFLVAGMNLGPLGAMPAMGASEFGAAVALVLAIWLGREWIKKEKDDDAAAD